MVKTYYLKKGSNTLIVVIRNEIFDKSRCLILLGTEELSSTVGTSAHWPGGYGERFCNVFQTFPSVFSIQLTVCFCFSTGVRGIGAIRVTNRIDA